MDTEGSFKAWWKDNLDPASMAGAVKEMKVCVRAFGLQSPGGSSTRGRRGEKWLKFCRDKKCKTRTVVGGGKAGRESLLFM